MSGANSSLEAGCATLGFPTVIPAYRSRRVPKTWTTQSVSNFSGLSGLEFGTRFSNQVIKLTSSYVNLNLFIPQMMVEFEEPYAELC